MNDLIRKAAAVGLGLASILALFIMLRVQTRGVFFGALSAWLAVVVGASIVLRNSCREMYRHLPLSIATVLACAGLFTLLEKDAWRYFLIGFTGIVITLLSGWSVHEGGGVQTTQKPYRRMKMMLWVFDAYAIATTLFACVVFYPQIPFWSLHLAGALTYAFVSVSIWRMYVVSPVPQTLLSVALMGLLSSELFWVFSLLPFGYLVSGFFVTWIWYIMQLLVRFHFSPLGIVWKRQAWFLAVNAVLFVALLVQIVRWV